jgi:hypothetical protein
MPTKVINYIEHVASNDRVIMNDRFMMREAAVTCFDALTQHWLGLTEENDGIY